MEARGKVKKKRKHPFLKIFMFGLMILVPILGWLIFSQHGLVRLYQLELEKQEVIHRINLLKRENQALLREIQRLRTDPDYIESIAREELGLVKKNDLIIRFSDEPSATTDNK